MVEDRRAVLGSHIGPLAIDRCRVVGFPEKLKKFFVADFGRVERNFDRFSVARFIRADVLVGRVFHGTSGISGPGRQDARTGAVKLLHALEAPCGKRGGFRVWFLGFALHGFHSHFFEGFIILNRESFPTLFSWFSR